MTRSRSHGAEASFALSSGGSGDEAIEQVTANPELHTRDLGGNASTADVTRAVCELLSAPA